MYLRTTRVKKTNGQVAEYAQLCHNTYDSEKKRSKVNIVYNFGNTDKLDLESLRRLVRSVVRFLEPEEAEEILKSVDKQSPFEYIGSLGYGGTYLLNQLWKKLGIDSILKNLLRRRGYTTPIERLLFAMVANRALNPSSKLAMEDWVGKQVHVDDLPEVEVHQLYRAMDFLLEASEIIQKNVFFSVANLFNLKVDVVFFDTTSTYFEIEGEDADTEESEGFRKRGYSKDDRPDLAQVVIGFALTREGIPVRCWSWPGNTADQSIVEEVKQDLNSWELNRVIFVGDTGFNSPSNRLTLQGAFGQYILGEKMRYGKNTKLHEALCRAGSYRKIKGDLKIKEVIVDPDSVCSRRFIVVCNEKEAEKDRKRRDSIVAEVKRRLAALDQMDGTPHRKAACLLRGHRAFGRYIRQTKTGKLCLDKGKIRQEEKLDGKYLISTSDTKLTPEEIVGAYRQLWRIERLYRDMKHVVDIRPVYHRLADRIRSHVLLCWLALLLIRICENETGETWSRIQKNFLNFSVGILRTSEGEVWQTSALNPPHKEIFKRLKIDLPPKYLTITTQKS